MGEDEDECRRLISGIQILLEDGNEMFFSQAVRDVLSGSEVDFENFLVSNELWGGSGSLADSAFCYQSGPKDSEENQLRRKRKKSFENLMIHLGRLQLRLGKKNVRTLFWVEAFESWKQAGLS
jgi:hypothetical protein